ALHSQLAQFLLDRYSSHGGVWSPGEPEPGFLHADALQRLVVLSHSHSRECGFVPDVKPPAPGGASRLVWECVAGHSFSWGVASMVEDSTSTSGPQGEEREDSGCSSPPSSARRRSLRRGLTAESDSGKDEAKPEGAAQAPSDDVDQREELEAGGDDGTAEQGVELQEGEEEEEEDDFAEDDDLTYTDDLRDENYHPSLDSYVQPMSNHFQPHPTNVQPHPTNVHPHPDISNQCPTTSKQCPTSSSRIQPMIRLERHQPQGRRSTTSLEMFLSRCSCKRRAQVCDEDVAQIGPKRIRKAAKREILLCDFEGCGKIFSNRQYLNHHKKYQHVHQKTFTCSEPSCGKSFNFKKHLKEHEKLHSDKRDYICEFCARSFRTSSNLIIHRRIHTGEKPLQCEICGFTCRQKASLNWHMKKHDADSFYQFSCDICGKKFEKKDNVTAHKSKSHPEAPTGTSQS
ncbi:Zinc finger protein 692, partial [Cuculus canorus]